MWKLSFLFLVSFVVAHRVDLYTLQNYEGTNHNVEVTGNCSLLPAMLRENLLSAKTHEGCIRLCEGNACDGACISVGVGIPGSCTSQNNFNQCNFGDKAVSYKAC